MKHSADVSFEPSVEDCLFTVKHANVWLVPTWGFATHFGVNTTICRTFLCQRYDLLHILVPTLRFVAHFGANTTICHTFWCQHYDLPHILVITQGFIELFGADSKIRNAIICCIFCCYLKSSLTSTSVGRKICPNIRVRYDLEWVMEVNLVTWAISPALRGATSSSFPHESHRKYLKLAEVWPDYFDWFSRDEQC